MRRHAPLLPYARPHNNLRHMNGSLPHNKNECRFSGVSPTFLLTTSIALRHSYSTVAVALQHGTFVESPGHPPPTCLLLAPLFIPCTISYREPTDNTTRSERQSDHARTTASHLAARREAADATSSYPPCAQDLQLHSGRLGTGSGSEEEYEKWHSAVG